MMKRTLFVLSVSLLLSVTGCASDAVIQEYMIIEPHTLMFLSSDTVKTVSITHSCTCPFSWTDSVHGGGNWLVFPAGMSGDHADITVTVLHGLLPADTNRALIYVSSNAYGSDTIGITAIK